MRTNTKIKFTEITHEGAPAARMNAVQALRRSVCACLLWEDEFYEDGQEIAKRIEKLVSEVPDDVVMALAVEARSIMNLRHVPLFLLSSLAKLRKLDKWAVSAVIQRADELSELLAIHAKLNGVTPDKVKKTIPAQMKQGLALAFGKFDEYQLGKYDRAGAIRLRDVLFLCHAKPTGALQADLWKRLIENKLAVPDTWEVGLSTGGDKKETFTRLLQEKKLGYFALLRNLRNMMGAGVEKDLVEQAIIARKGGAEKVLPFRYIAAARACPQLEPALDKALIAAIEQSAEFSGTTAIVVDVSGSMDVKLSGKSDMTRMDAAAALACLIHGNKRVFAFSNHTKEVPARNGMAGIDAIQKSMNHGGTCLGEAIMQVGQMMRAPDRLIVITDEQSHDRGPRPNVRHAYMINVASAKNGVGYGNGWVHLDGFSEGVIKYMHAMESVDSVS